MNLFTRIKLAGQLVLKGSLWPFNIIPPDSGGSAGEKISEPYKKSSWVMRAIKHVAEPIASVSLKFSSDRRGGKTLITDPALIQFWEEPAVGLSGYDFIHATVGWLKLEGESFWLIQDGAVAPFPEVKGSFPQLILARPDRMRAITAGSRPNAGDIQGWEFTDGAGRRFALLPNQVIHLKFWNPYDDIRGLGEYEAAQLAADAEYQGIRFQANLMANNGDQGAVISHKGGQLDDKQREQLTQQLRMKRELQQRGIFRPIFLEGDIEIEDPKIRTVDAAFIASRVDSRKEIFIAFGVPASMAEAAASYSIGSASDRLRLIEDTCMPTGKKIAEGIERVSRLMLLGSSGTKAAATKRTVFAWFNWKEHSVMQQVRSERAKEVDTYWSKGVPMSVINDFLDLGLPPYQGWENSYLNFNVSNSVDATLLPDGTLDEALAEPATDPVQEMRKALQAGRPRSRPPKRLAMANAYFAARRPTMKLYAARFNKVLMSARAEVLAKLDGSSEGKSAEEFLFNLHDFTVSFNSEMAKTGRVALATAGEQCFEELKAQKIKADSDPFTFPPEKVLVYLHQRENKLSGVPQEVFERIIAAIEEGLKDGDSIDKLSDAVRAEFNEISKGRGRVIASTETAAAYGTARQEAFEQSGIKWKQWLTSSLPNVRPAHAAAEEQIVAVDDPFKVGGEDLAFPGDPHGSPENVINCHCVAIAVAKGPEPEEEA